MNSIREIARNAQAYGMAHMRRVQEDRETRGLPPLPDEHLEDIVVAATVGYEAGYLRLKEVQK